MITLNDLLPKTATAVPDRLRAQLVLVEEAIDLEGRLEAAAPGPRGDRLWRQACARTSRRLDRLIEIIEEHNRQELGR